MSPLTAATSAIRFRKMHGLGNDFVIVDARPGRPDACAPLSLAQVQRMADRHFGIGCDQLIQLEPSAHADLFMRIYNQDGSESGACGNATRCVAALLCAELGRNAVTIETLSGLLPAQRRAEGQITVDMGPARLDWQDIPLAAAADTLAVPLPGIGSVTCVNMGNPHAVLFVEDAEAVDLPRLGPLVEGHPLFPQRSNFEVVSLIGSNHLRQRTFERGSGITLACGSGACAVAVAAARRGLTGREVTITLDGGDLQLDWRQSDGHVLMTGPYALAFEGLWHG